MDCRGLPLQQVLDKLEVSDRVSTFPRGGGSSIWFYTRCCETSGWRADCDSVFFSHPCFYKRTCRTKPVKEQFQSQVGRFRNLGTLQEAFETRPRSLPFVDFSTSGQDTQGQLKVSFAGTLVLRFYEHSLSYKKDPGSLCFSCSLFRKLHLLPKPG